MKYYSTNHNAPEASLRVAVERGLAPDRGLYMPEQIKRLPREFFEHIDELSFQELSLEVAKAFFGDDVEPDALKRNQLLKTVLLRVDYHKTTRATRANHDTDLKVIIYPAFDRFL